MSREEADAEENKKKSDDMRLTLAIQKSKEEVGSNEVRHFYVGAFCKNSPLQKTDEKSSALNDLVDLNFGGPAVGPNPPQRTAASLDPWSPVGEGINVLKVS